MISRVDSNPWSPPDLTGNSALVVVGQDLVLVGGRRADGTQAVYRSNSYGAQWSVVCTIPAPQGTMDPMVALDTLGLLHIVVGRPNTPSSPAILIWSNAPWISPHMFCLIQLF